MGNMPEIESKYADTYKRIHVSGVFGGTRPYGLEVVLYSESMNVKKSLETEQIDANRMILKRTAECEAVIDPLQMKSIYRWLGEKIKEYERIYGAIPSPEEIASRAKRG